jgi:sugar/nucleoside kinase (ribokinase family)
MNIVETSAEIERDCVRLGYGIDVAGGSAANTAVGVASLGGSAAFIGKVAEDQYGRIFRHDIRGAGVTFTTPATAIPGKETSHSLILVTPDGQRTMNTFLGCSTEIDDALLDVETIKNSKIIYLEGYLVESRAANASLHRAAELANAAGRTVALSLSDSQCVDRHRAEYLKLVRAGVGVLFANESEILSLYETQSFDEAIRRVGTDTALAVLTRSERGSVIVSKGVAIKVAPEKVSKVVDATGAGDIYAAGFLFGLCRGMDVEASGHLASVAASEIIGQIGARPEARLAHVVRMRGLLSSAR